MKRGEICICSVSERISEILKIVGDTLMDVSELEGEVLIRIFATEEEWQIMKPRLLAR